MLVRIIRIIKIILKSLSFINVNLFFHEIASSFRFASFLAMTEGCLFVIARSGTIV